MRLSTEYCYTCKANTKHFNGDCGHCSSEKERIARQKFADETAKLSVEGRLRRLEAWMLETNRNPPWIEPRY